jgi:hypothetical protein
VGFINEQDLFSSSLIEIINCFKWSQ